MSIFALRALCMSWICFSNKENTVVKLVESWSVEWSLLLMSQEIMQLFFPMVVIKKKKSILSVLQILLWACCWLPGNVTFESYAYHMLTKPYATDSCVKGGGKKVLISKGPTSFQTSWFCKAMATGISLLSLAPGVWVILFLLIRQLEMAFGLVFVGVTLLTLLQRLPGCCSFCKPTASLFLLQGSSLPLCSSSTSFALTFSWSLGHPRLIFVSSCIPSCFHLVLLGYFLDMWGKRTIWAQLQKEGDAWPRRAMRSLCQCVKQVEMAQAYRKARDAGTSAPAAAQCYLMEQLAQMVGVQMLLWGLGPCC